MKSKVLIGLFVVVLIGPACIPLPPVPPPPTATVTPVVQTQTETASPGETSTATQTATTPFSETATETSTANATATETSTPTAPQPPVTIPSLEDWDSGTFAFSRGAEGEWDHILWGGFANSLIKKGDTYYLYYQGSLTYDDTCESVAYRAIGVATSTDGIQWTKYEGNPVLTWTSQGSVEEGAASSAAWVGPDGKVYLYYGANTGTGCHVNASVRLAVSEDGLHFQDAGEVLGGRDPNVWGSGDEIFSVGGYSYANRWYLFYIPNGTAFSRKLGVAIGEEPSRFTQTTGVNNSSTPAWGPVSVVLDGEEAILISNPHGVDGILNFYRFEASDPSSVPLEKTYTIPNCRQASAIYESSTRHWMLSCRDQTAENYFIRNAFTP